MNSTPYPVPRVKDLATSERPQERLEKHGATTLSDTELLAMLLRSGSKGLSVVGMSQQLITEAGSLAGLTRWREADFRKIKGIGRIKALQLITVMEISRRVMGAAAEPNPVLNRPELIYAHFRPLVTGLPVEKFWVLCLNRKNRLIKQVEITSGTATSSLLIPAKFFVKSSTTGRPRSSACTTTRAATPHPARPTCRSPGSCARRPGPSISISRTM